MNLHRGTTLRPQSHARAVSSAYRIATPALLTLLVLQSAFAQPNPTPERKKLIFTPGGNHSSTEKNASPNPSPSTTAASSEKNPQQPPEIVTSFFEILASGQTSQAYRFLLRGSILSDRQNDVDAIESRTKDALDQYGPFATFEILNQQPVGDRLLRLTCLTLNSDLPLRWRFYFYKPKDSWVLVDLRIDDGIVELFDEKKKP